jgi:hypothetical protein
MHDRKSSLGRGAASIFSGVSRQSEDDSRISEEDKLIAEKRESEYDIQKKNDENPIAEIQESLAEKQILNDDKNYDETHHSPVNTKLGEKNEMIAEKQESEYDIQKKNGDYLIAESQESLAEKQILKDVKNYDESHHSSVDITLGENLQILAESQQSSIINPKTKDEVQDIDVVSLELATKEGMKYPKVTVYSPLIASFMRYKEITIPRFKLSPEAEGRLEKVLKRENPELWKAAEEGVQWNKKKEPQRPKEDANEVNLAFVEQSIEEGMKYPKVTIYSPIIAAFMRYLEITIPRFKLSPAVEGRLEKVLKREDAELWKAIEERISWKKRKR